MNKLIKSFIIILKMVKQTIGNSEVSNKNREWLKHKKRLVLTFAKSIGYNEEQVDMLKGLMFEEDMTFEYALMKIGAPKNKGNLVFFFQSNRNILKAICADHKVAIGFKNGAITACKVQEPVFIDHDYHCEDDKRLNLGISDPVFSYGYEPWESIGNSYRV